MKVPNNLLIIFILSIYCVLICIIMQVSNTVNRMVFVMKEVDKMTKNQIDYLNNRELQRHNLIMEEQNQKSLDEGVRHNLATEQTNWFVANTNRSIGEKQAQASLGQAAAAGTNAAAGMMNAYTSRLQQSELVRHNQAVESENVRHNKQMEGVQWRNASTQEWNTSINQQNAQTNSRNSDINFMNAKMNASRTLYQNTSDLAKSFGSLASLGHFTK